MKLPYSPFCKKIAVFGSTGSIGTQTLEIIKAYPNLFKVSILVAYENINLLAAQTHIFQPEIVVIFRSELYTELIKELSLSVKVLAGGDGLLQAARSDKYDVMVAAMSGCLSLPAIFAALDAGKKIALANKEAIVMAGKLLMEKTETSTGTIIPVDSEHSGVFQCLQGELEPYDNIVNRITLTASGGPFFRKKTNFLVRVKKEHALAHPVWNMGTKITIDSATLMNKGLELIEARWLFKIAPQKIQAIVHPECRVHSLVSFIDNSVKVQMAVSDMKIPILIALSYPYRVPSSFENQLNIAQLEKLTFEPIDEDTFKCFRLAKEVLLQDNINACILNAANEVAVQYFVDNKIGFLDIAEIVEIVLAKHNVPDKYYGVTELQAIDAEIRSFTDSIIKNYRSKFW